MNTLETIFLNTEKNFTVNKKDVNNNKALLPNVLYKEMEQFVQNSISSHQNFVFHTPQLFKLQILKNAHLNDKLLLKAQVKKLNQFELQISVVVKHKNNNDEICKGLFKFQLEEKISKAS